VENTPSKHHLDRRADQLLEQQGDGDDLLDTKQLSAWLGVSTQWLEIGRTKGYGPKFVKLGPRMIRYKRRDVLNWLKARKLYASTREVR
jgi:predicted DNA-binding transcriptional regulator AlpA